MWSKLSTTCLYDLVQMVCHLLLTLSALPQQNVIFCFSTFLKAAVLLTSSALLWNNSAEAAAEVLFYSWFQR